MPTIAALQMYGGRVQSNGGACEQSEFVTTKLHGVLLNGYCNRGFGSCRLKVQSKNYGLEFSCRYFTLKKVWPISAANTDDIL